MKHALQLLGIAGLVVSLVGTVLAEPIGDPRTYTGPVDNRRLICMSMKNAVQAKEGIEVQYQGKSYYLCCQGCVSQFRNDPEKFRVAEDPVSRSLVDKAEGLVYAYKGSAYFFESEKTRQAFVKEPFRYVPEEGR